MASIVAGWEAPVAIGLAQFYDDAIATLKSIVYSIVSTEQK